MCEQGGAHATRGDRPHGHPGPDGDRVPGNSDPQPAGAAGQAGKGGDHLSRPLLPAVLPECSLESGGIGSPACPAHLHAQRQPSPGTQVTNLLDRIPRREITGTAPSSPAWSRRSDTRSATRTSHDPFQHGPVGSQPPRWRPPCPAARGPRPGRARCRRPSCSCRSVPQCWRYPDQRVGRLLGHSVIDVPNGHRTDSLDQHGCHTTPAQGDPATTRRRDDQPQIT
jgi:hypothetical protein